MRAVDDTVDEPCREHGFAFADGADAGCGVIHYGLIPFHRGWQAGSGCWWMVLHDTVTSGCLARTQVPDRHSCLIWCGSCFVLASVGGGGVCGLVLPVAVRAFGCLGCSLPGFQVVGVPR